MLTVCALHSAWQLWSALGRRVNRSTVSEGGAAGVSVDAGVAGEGVEGCAEVEVIGGGGGGGVVVGEDVYGV